jgi:hypothetical protein
VGQARKAAEIEPIDPEELVRRVLEAREQIADRVADMEPGDVFSILQSLMRPPGTGRRFFLRTIAPGIHVL